MKKEWWDNEIEVHPVFWGGKRFLGLGYGGWVRLLDGGVHVPSALNDDPIQDVFLIATEEEARKYWSLGRTDIVFPSDPQKEGKHDRLVQYWKSVTHHDGTKTFAGEEDISREVFFLEKLIRFFEEKGGIADVSKLEIESHIVEIGDGCISETTAKRFAEALFNAMKKKG